MNYTMIALKCNVCLEIGHFFGPCIDAAVGEISRSNWDIWNGEQRCPTCVEKLKALVTTVEKLRQQRTDSAKSATTCEKSCKAGKTTRSRKTKSSARKSGSRSKSASTASKTPQKKSVTKR